MTRNSLLRTSILVISLLLLSVAPILASNDATLRLVPTPPTVKGVTATPPGPPISRDSGGPDGFGYTFIDSNEGGGPTPNFFDISGTGTAVFLGDDAEISVPLGITFPFYGANQTSTFLVSNGYLAFDGGSSGVFTNDCPFNTTTPSPTNAIAPFWDDLDPADDGAAAFHQSFSPCPVGSGDCFIAQWEEFDFFPGDGVGGGTAGTFQTILFDSGDILFEYDANFVNQSGTVGLNNDGAANSLVAYCDDPTSPAAGDAVLFQAGATTDVGITKTGTVSTPSPFTYTLQLENFGPEDQTGLIVEDTIPANVTYISDTCGGSLAGSIWTWNAGSLTNGSIDTCELTVQADFDTCETVSNTAAIVAGDIADTNPGNNTSTTSNGGGGGANAVADPGFEAGTPNPSWTEASTNFGTTLCDVGSCGTGTGTGPRTGDFWSWFGGIAAAETGSVSQSIVIEPGTATLSFWTEAIICDSAADFMEVLVDGTQVFLMDGTDATCGNLGYVERTVDVSAWADGNSHTLEFRSEIFANNGGGSNFFLDDVSVTSVGMPVCEVNQVPITEVPTADHWALLLLAAGLGLVAVLRMRH